jgi:hypothetical protein
MPTCTVDLIELTLHSFIHTLIFPSHSLPTIAIVDNYSKVKQAIHSGSAQVGSEWSKNGMRGNFENNGWCYIESITRHFVPTIELRPRRLYFVNETVERQRQ